PEEQLLEKLRREVILPKESLTEGEFQTISRLKNRRPGFVNEVHEKMIENSPESMTIAQAGSYSVGIANICSLRGQRDLLPSINGKETLPKIGWMNSSSKTSVLD
ncbi:MAG: hypothetical protein OK457_10745, partial [Thaumarchaeota archaeon]|nr:hypothetical protein [Nitrososphaerota archaeon]